MTVEQTSNDPKRALCEEGSSSIARNFKKMEQKMTNEIAFLII